MDHNQQRYFSNGENTITLHRVATKNYAVRGVRLKATAIYKQKHFDISVAAELNCQQAD